MYTYAKLWIVFATDGQSKTISLLSDPKIVFRWSQLMAIWHWGARMFVFSHPLLVVELDWRVIGNRMGCVVVEREIVGYEGEKFWRVFLMAN